MGAIVQIRERYISAEYCQYVAYSGRKKEEAVIFKKKKNPSTEVYAHYGKAHALE